MLFLQKQRERKPSKTWKDKNRCLRTMSHMDSGSHLIHFISLYILRGSKVSPPNTLSLKQQLRKEKSEIQELLFRDVKAVVNIVASINLMRIRYFYVIILFQ